MDLQIFTTKNAIMENCLQELITSIDPDLKCGIFGLSKALLSRFVIHQGCYLLECALPRGFIPYPEQEFTSSRIFPDRTGYECGENHLHTSYLLANHEKGYHHLLAGIVVADNLRYKLKSEFPPGRFRIIVSFNVFPMGEDDDDIRKDCTVRFHSVRTGEVIYDDLEDFKYEAMGVIEVL